MAHHRLSPRQYLILGVVAVSAPLGDSCLSRGMAAMPPISLAHPGSLIAAVFTPWIALGIALLIGFFASYLTALSWADLTFVLPATAFGYVIIALLARFWLQEAISLERVATERGSEDLTIETRDTYRRPGQRRPGLTLDDADDGSHRRLERGLLRHLLRRSVAHCPECRQRRKRAKRQGALSRTIRQTAFHMLSFLAIGLRGGEATASSATPLTGRNIVIGSAD